jgi:hypothetical protein
MELHGKRHRTTPLRLPPSMRTQTADIDERIAPLIQRLWRLGYVTHYCCQGDARQDHVDQAYITFRSVLEACLFVAQAGPLAWDHRTHRQREAELPGSSQRWTWDWRLEGDIVRFPARDIARATATLIRTGKPLVALIGAVSEAPVPLLPAPPQCERCGWEPMPCPSGAAEPRLSAPRPRCPTCGGLILARRRDARYCSRRCQLAARDRQCKEP